MKVLVAAIILVGICVLLLSVGILAGRGFPQYDVGSNEKLKARGITCYKDEDARLHRRSACSGNFSDACRDCALYPSVGRSLPRDRND